MIIRDSFQVVTLVALCCYVYTHFQLKSALEIRKARSYISRSNQDRCPHVPIYHNLPIQQRNGINCDLIANNDEKEITLSLLKRLGFTRQKIGISSSWQDTALKAFITKEGCQLFRESRQYLTISPHKEEDTYPIAYSIVVHRGAGQLERLIRSIYRPQNWYCIHVDKKADPEFYSAVEKYASCFPNVFLSTNREDVIYAHFSRLQADLNCMADLVDSGRPWKYLINLCGQDFPLKTNYQMVTYLKYLYPFHSIETFEMPPHKKVRYQYSFSIKEGTDGEYTRGLQRTSVQKEVNPLGQNQALFGGSAYIVVTREFVDWVLTNSTIQAFLNWSRDTYSPDEMIWATLTRLPGAPGYRHPHKKWDQNELQTITRIVKWASFEQGVVDSGVYPRCSGYHKRGICVYGIGDVGWLLDQSHFFGNKFDDSRMGDDGALQCLESTLRKFEHGESCSPLYEYDRSKLHRISDDVMQRDNDVISEENP